jgi:DNA repair photolyase
MKAWGTLRPARFDDKELKVDLGEGNTIFVGNSNDMFASNIPDDWIDKTIDHCKKFNNTYVFQTKNPGRLVEMEIKLPKLNIGTTIETNRQDLSNLISKAPSVFDRSLAMTKLHNLGIKTFITIEPIMEFDLNDLVDLIVQASPDFINIGADSKFSGLIEPSKAKVDQLIQTLKSKGMTIREKTNLGRLV